MADQFEDWLSDLSERTGASVEQDDLERLRNTNPGDDLDRLMDAYESQYKRRGDSGQTGSGRDSSEMTAEGYGSGRNETKDDIAGMQPLAGGGGSSNSVISSWTGGNSGVNGGGGQTFNLPDWYRGIMERQQAQAEAAAAANKQRSDALYAQLQEGARQSLNIDRNDPIIRQQADAFSANQERARRNYISDTAEAAGPYANIQGEKRMASERYGAETGAFEAKLYGQELMARRAEIADRLKMMAGMLSGEQIQALQRDLALMDQQIKEQQVAMGLRGQDLDNDQFLRDLALKEWDRGQHWNYQNIYGNS